MRLFLAVNFPDEVKKKLAELQEAIKKHTARGNYTLYENLHLTLVFLGEVPQERVQAVCRAMDSVPTEPLDLRIRGMGSFPTRDGSALLWAGVDGGGSLVRLQSGLTEALGLAGFRVERREFTPHLTLVRQAVLKESFDPAAFSRDMGELCVRVTKVSLMKSERTGGRLRYTELR